MLVEAGFQFLLAVDASCALALDEQHHPDLAIVDVDLGRAAGGLALPARFWRDKLFSARAAMG